jgi:carbamoyltransferase
MLILGIGGWRHDGAAALLRDGEIVAAIEEEKLERQPHAGGLPATAIETCLQIAKASHDAIGVVAIARPLDSSSEPAFHLRLKALFPNARMVVLDHHVARCGAFYSFRRSAVLTADCRGDMRCALWRGRRPAPQPLLCAHAGRVV